MPALRGLYRNMSGRLTPRGKALSVLGVFLLLGVLLSVLNIPMAASAANALAVKRIENAFPTAPQSLSGTSDDSRYRSAPAGYSRWRHHPHVRVPPGGRPRVLGHGFVGRRHPMNLARAKRCNGRALPIDPSHRPYQCMGRHTGEIGSGKPHWSGRRSIAWRTLWHIIRGVGSVPYDNAIARRFTRMNRSYALSYHVAANGICISSCWQGRRRPAPWWSSPSSSAFAVGTEHARGSVEAVSTWNPQFQPPNRATRQLITLGPYPASAAVVAFIMRRSQPRRQRAEAVGIIRRHNPNSQSEIRIVPQGGRVQRQRKRKDISYARVRRFFRGAGSASPTSFFGHILADGSGLRRADRRDE